MTAESIAEIYRDTVWGHVLHDAGHGEGRQEGRQEGLEEGLERGRQLLLADLLTERFGPAATIPEIARRLAHWPSGAVQAVHAAASIDDLTGAEPPS